MPRIAPVETAAADPAARTLLEAVQKKLGTTPNMMSTMAQSPAVLEGYLNLSAALANGSLGGPLGELIALDVAETNGCAYCLSAHTYLGANVAGLESAEMDAARLADSEEPKVRAALQFARQVNDQRGDVTDQQVQAVRAAGFDDGAIVEIIANVALNVLTNYLNTATQVEVDFPEVRPAAESVTA